MFTSRGEGAANLLQISFNCDWNKELGLKEAENRWIRHLTF